MLYCFEVRICDEIFAKREPTGWASSAESEIFLTLKEKISGKGHFIGLGGKRGVRRVENAVYKMQRVENAKCRKCGE